MICTPTIDNAVALISYIFKTSINMWLPYKFHTYYARMNVILVFRYVIGRGYCTYRTPQAAPIKMVDIFSVLIVFRHFYFRKAARLVFTKETCEL